MAFPSCRSHIRSAASEAKIQLAQQNHEARAQEHDGYCDQALQASELIH
jgi:hypothetical protein